MEQQSLLPPGKWSPEATFKFYERHNYDVYEMIKTIEKWDFVGDPGAFAAKIADFCRSTTFWRGPVHIKRMKKYIEEKEASV